MNDTLDRALIAATWGNDMAEATRLIAEGADVNAKDETIQSAYLISTSEGYVDLLKLTLAHGADIRSTDSYNGTGLIRAADRGHAEVIARLLRAGVDVNHVNNLGWTALHEAIILGNGDQRYIDCVRLLFSGGADPELPSQGDGIRPLGHAESQGSTVIASTIRRMIESDPPEDAEHAIALAARDGDPDGIVLGMRTASLTLAQGENAADARRVAEAAGHDDCVRLLTLLTGE